jgi:hypothetical protein
LEIFITTYFLKFIVAAADTPLCAGLNTSSKRINYGWKKIAGTRSSDLFKRSDP